jgi:hypothetical protein
MPAKTSHFPLSPRLSVTLPVSARSNTARHKRFAPADLFTGERGHHDGKWPGNDQPERTYSGTESDHRAKHEKGTAERPAIEPGPASFNDGIGDKQHPEQAKQHRKAARQHSRPHAPKGSNGQIRALPKSKGGDPDHRQSANEILL